MGTGAVMNQDSPEQLKEDLLENNPEAVWGAVEDKAHEFLMACVKYAYTMKHSDDPFQGIRHLTDALIWVQTAQQGLEREIAVDRKPKSTMQAFRE